MGSNRLFTMEGYVMTHVEVDNNLIPTIGTIGNVLGSCGAVDYFDFSRANSSYEARVAAVTKVASICYGNPKALGSINLFNRLQAESAGLPSSSYEFVPVLITVKDFVTSDMDHDNCEKYGEWILNDNYLLTNLRALIEDVGPEESLNYLNTSDKEIQIIRDNFHVFLFNIDVPTRTQMIRHRISWQELSRRYVSGKKTPFKFYTSEKMKNICIPGETTVQQFLAEAVKLYDMAIEKGVKPEEARRILPQAMMTTIWGAFQPKQLENFFTLRLDKHAQKEIRQVAEAMKELIND